MTARKVLDKAMTEAELQSAVIEYAHLRGWLVAHFRPAQTGKGWRTPMQGDPGFPDLVMARNGIVVLAELKREGAKLTDAQAAWGRAMDQMFVWQPSDWRTIQAVLA